MTQYIYPVTNLSYRCSGPVGIYFLVKRCVVLYLWADSGSFISPPYLDAHGELDIGLRHVNLPNIHAYD